MYDSEELEQISKNLETEKVIQLMYALGADRHKETETCVIFPTICHNTSAADASDKLYFYKDRKIFYCYTECGGQSIFAFLRHYYESHEIVYNWFTDIYEVAKNCAFTSLTEGFIERESTYEKLTDRYARRSEIKLPIVDEGILSIFVKTYPSEWLTEGISKAAMDKYNILYSIPRNKIIIPHYDINGNLVGIRGRALNKEEIENFGKYAPVKIEQTWYSHPLAGNLYGLNYNKDNIKSKRICYIYESEKSVLQHESFPEPNCAVAVCGSNFNKFQLNLLLKNCYPEEIVICFDKEEKKGSDKYFEKLRKICQRYNNYCNFSFIYDREELLEMKDSPSDKGYNTFKKLLERRVKVK